MHEGSTPDPEGIRYRASDHDSSPDDLIRLGEYRPITILFADLVGSTLIAQGYDREDLRDIIQKFRNVVRPIVDQWGGSNPRAFGDALMFSFGHPKTHEDDPERALRAAQQIHAALVDLTQQDGIRYQAHIGIATDMILVGEEQDRDTFRSDEFFGDGPILASKLQGEAGPGETVICEATNLRINDLFRCEVLPGRNYKNFGGAIDVYRVLGEVAGAAHLGRINRRPPSGFVGRNAELTELMDIWEKTRSEGCQIVSLSGEAGIGKSRLMTAQRRHLALGKHNSVIYKCLRHYDRTPFFPFITQLEFWAGIRDSDPTEVRARKLDSVLGEMLSPIQQDILKAMMAPDRSSAKFLADIPVDAFHEHVLNIFVTTITTLVRDVPALLHFEDVHWIDPSSRRLLIHALPMIRELPVMLVASHRDEVPSFLEGDNVTAIDLQGLPDNTARDLVRSLPNTDELDARTVERIIEVTNGVPLFIEHYTSNVLSGALPPSDEPVNIPEQIYGLLFEQLDDAGPDRSVALAATAIGRPFDTPLLAAAAGMPIAETQAVIDRLLQNGMLTETRSSAELPYRFSHVMVQDAGYQSMVKRHRRILHERIAQHLVDERPELADRAPELLARQFREAGITDRAILMSLHAGNLACSRFANNEAMEHAERGLHLLKDLPKSFQPELGMQLYLLLAVANSAENGFGSAATLDGFEKSYELASEVGDDKALLRSAQGLFAAYHAHANYDRAGSIGEEIHEMIVNEGGNLNSARARAIADRIIGASLIWRGEFEEAHSILERALSQSGSDSGNGRYDSSAHQTLASLALTEAFRGNSDAATRLSREAIATAQKTGTPMAIGNAMLMACNVHQILRHPDALKHSEALEAYGSEQRMPFYAHGARAFSGVALYQDPDRIEEGYNLLLEAWPKFQGTAARANQVFVCVERAEGLRLMDRTEEALAAIEEGIALSNQYNERNFDAELHRLHGALLIEAGDNSETPIECLERAISTAKQQGARLFMLRALSEAAALAARGQAEAGFIDRLEEMLATFDPDDASKDVTDARGVLEAARK